MNLCLLTLDSSLACKFFPVDASSMPIGSQIDPSDFELTFVAGVFVNRYIMFPIGIMYYFGTNLDNRFSVRDFWPARDTTHRIPFEREEINSELSRLRSQRLERRAKRLEAEGSEDN
jgi:protein PET100